MDNHFSYREVCSGGGLRSIFFKTERCWGDFGSSFFLIDTHIFSKEHGSFPKKFFSILGAVVKSSAKVFVWIWRKLLANEEFHDFFKNFKLLDLNRAVSDFKYTLKLVLCFIGRGSRFNKCGEKFKNVCRELAVYCVVSRKTNNGYKLVCWLDAPETLHWKSHLEWAHDYYFQ